MTKQAPSRKPEPTGRHSEPIEITPEMIEAGVPVLRRFDEEFSSPREGVLLVIEAVLEAGGFRVARN